jgi:hypothetical protein
MKANPIRACVVFRDIAAMYSSAFDIDEFDVRVTNEVARNGIMMYTFPVEGRVIHMEGETESGIKPGINLVGDLWEFKSCKTTNLVQKVYVFYMPFIPDGMFLF